MTKSPYPPICAAFLFFITVFQLQAQSLRGYVRASDSGEPLMGATVKLYYSYNLADSVSQATSPQGEYLYEKLKPGYYHCRFEMQGFEPMIVREILIAAGKEQVLEIAMARSNSELPEVTIASTIPGRRSLQPMSEIPLTRDQTLRFPSMYFDPGRLAAAYPGVQQADDGTNMMSIRGNSPAYVRWRIEGLDIVNPNHLPNAGTLFDAPASASGGVLMFSAQMLDNSSLLTGAYPAGYGDAVAGVMDMNLRAGNSRQHEFTAQAGLIGLDLAAEGPLAKHGDNKASYLVNYRYSTVGLLGALGVSFGDEQIDFQDLSFNIHARGKKGGQYSFFGMGGLSKNVFRHKTDSAEIKFDKDRYDIDFESKTGVMGGSARWKLGNSTWLKSAVVFSTQTNDWQKDDTRIDTFKSFDNRAEQRIAGSLELKHAWKQFQVYATLQASKIYFDAHVFKVVSLEGPFYTFYEPYYAKADYTNLQPSARFLWTSGNGKWSTDLGAQFHYNSVYRKFAPAPRAMLTYRLHSDHRVSLSGGIYKQDAPVWLQYVQPRFGSEYRPPYVSSKQAGLSYTWFASPYWRVSAEAFYQYTTNTQYAQFQVSYFNNPEIIIGFNPEGSIDVQNRGIELTLERTLYNGWFLLANGTLFNSSYRFEDGDWLDSRWDIGHMTNVSFGKEWIREKSAVKTRTIGVGVRGIWAGGVREAEIDLGRSAGNNTTAYDEAKGFEKQYPDYFRIDFRVYWKRSLGNRKNSTFALDIQNLTGRQNLAYHFYDPLTQKVENKYQLGTIPNFSWRLEF